MLIDAAVLRSRTEPYVLEKVEMAEPRANEILVRIAAVGYCHTDVLLRGPVATELPIIPGHEGAGVVEAVGDSVSSVAVGDHVVLTFASCGACDPCGDGFPSYCAEFRELNVDGTSADGDPRVTGHDGHEIGSRWFGQSSFATHALVTEQNAVVIDRDLPLSLMAPLGCGVQSGAGAVLETFGLRPEQSLVVFGAGSVGLSALMAAKVAGASSIVAVDLHQHRLDLACELGATATFLATEEDLRQKIVDATTGGAHFAFDTTGVPEMVKLAIACLRWRGMLGMVGNPVGELVLEPKSLNGKFLTRVIEGGVRPHEFIPRLAALYRDGRFPVDRLVTTFPLSQINEAENASLEGRVIKPVLLP
ncbi:NAD(P)-dependent alcohol dehydrogenase [Ilumatobacter coccineus]|uniref:Aryl-alcohol dehydrogenase n=1 Tax=Ilumatobacter coccineus (strain NBRC 103263 / KCTC 29153 / YM16-304) TaxID=1313172 RepID=A0A6C7EA36_ILUCY|nr:NAD(P)-dependent alcohol dehydrogenase [Ilumatobacter coccineus]BAN02079.1 aryl-alcohol dehydrogenase [Ilumatobacter coccineus YM16-304]